MYRYIVFDLDGTITDSGKGIINSVIYALERMGIEVTDKAELKKFIGPPLMDSFRDFYGMSEEKCCEGVELYREYYREKGILENEVYDGIRELLERLKGEGKKIALATSKPDVFAKRVLENFGIDGYFDFISAPTLSNNIEKKELIDRVMKHFGAAADEVLMVGDRKFDIIGAKDCGVHSVGVLYGYGSEEELKTAGATFIAGTAEEVAEIAGV